MGLGAFSDGPRRSSGVNLHVGGKLSKEEKEETYTRNTALFSSETLLPNSHPKTTEELQTNERAGWVPARWWLVGRRGRDDYFAAAAVRQAGGCSQAFLHRGQNCNVRLRRSALSSSSSSLGILGKSKVPLSDSLFDITRNYAVQRWPAG